MPTTGLTIARAAADLGLTPDTLRYYERDGLLLRPVPRSATGHRRYQPGDLRWVELISRLRATGMPIRDIRRYAELVREGDGNEQARLELLLAHRTTVQAQLAEAAAHLAAIDHKIGIYTDQLHRSTAGSTAEGDPVQQEAELSA